VIIRLAIGMALSLEEVSRAQLLIAMGAREVFWMPRLAQGGYHLCSNNVVRLREIFERSRINSQESASYLAHNGLLAGVAASLLSRVDTLAAHVGLEVAEHRIQLILFDELALPRMLRLVEMSGVSLGDVYAGLRAVGSWQRALRALGRLVGLRVRGVGHRLMLMGATVDL